MQNHILYIYICVYIYIYVCMSYLYIATIVPCELHQPYIVLWGTSWNHHLADRQLHFGRELGKGSLSQLWSAIKSRCHPVQVYMFDIVWSFWKWTLFKPNSGGNKHQQLLFVVLWISVHCGTALRKCHVLTSKIAVNEEVTAVQFSKGT